MISTSGVRVHSVFPQDKLDFVPHILVINCLGLLVVDSVSGLNVTIFNYFFLNQEECFYPGWLLVSPGESPTLSHSLPLHDSVEQQHGLVDVIVVHHHCPRYPLVKQQSRF